MFVTDFLSRQIDRYNRGRRLSLEQYEQMLPRFEEEKEISKNIFQIYLLGNNSSVSDVMSKLTAGFVDNINKLKNNNPEYRYQLISDREAKHFITKYYGTKIWEYYQRIDKAYLAAKADFLRYLLLYAKGGVYLDLKSTIEYPLSTTLRQDDRFLLFYWDNMPGGNHNCLIPDYIDKGEMLQGFIISAKGHIFLRKVILNVLASIDQYNPYKSDCGVGWYGTLATVGPAIYTKTIYEAIIRQENVLYRESKPFAVFGYKVYFAEETYTPGGYLKSLSMKDFRKSSRPVIKSRVKWLQIINVVWLKFVQIYNRILVETCGY